MAITQLAVRPAMTARLPTVDVVICAYDLGRWDWLCEAVSSALDQSHEPQSCLVVIDHNQDLLEKARDRFVGPRVKVLANLGPAGLAGARNTGLQAAEAEIVAFLDDDARADELWLENLVRPYGDPAVIGTGGRVAAVWDSERPRWFPAEFGWVVGCEYVGLPLGEGPIRNPIGASMSFRRLPLLTEGGFRSGIGRTAGRSLGCEETEASIRLRKRTGGRIVYTPAASVSHHVGAERGRAGYFLRRCYNEGVSKAAVVRLAGADDGLASERSYVTKVLTRALARCVRDGARGRWESLGEGAAIVGGLFATAVGYSVGRSAAVVRGRVSSGGGPT